MANRKITELAALTTPAQDDVIPIVDISETSNATKNKKITAGNLIQGTPSLALQFADGTASAPSIKFTSALTTGLYRSAANELSIATNGGQAIKVEANNKTTIYGDLVVTGGTTTISSTQIDVNDKNLQLATGNSSDSGADGGGLTVKGATDKTWNWVDSTDAWTANQHIDVTTGKVFKIAGTEVLNATTLGSGVVSSSLTSVGTLGSLTVTNAVTAGSLDISGGADIDGTLEADAYTVNGTALNEYIADTVGSMVSSNTETNITVTYQDADNTLDFVIGTLNQDTTGNAATATALETARTIGGVSFNGTANINLPGVNQTGNQNTTGSAATLTTARTIGGVSFDGSANINLPGVNAAGNQNTSGTAAGLSGTPNITVGVVTAGSLDVSGNADIDGTLEADAITVDGTALNEYISDTIGAMVGSNTETGITVSYDDSDNTLDFVIGTLNQDTTGTAALATEFTVTANNSTDETVYPTFVDGATGSQGAETDTALTYNPSTGLFTSTAFGGSGANLTNLNASQLSSGTIAAARLSTATTQSAGNNSTKIATTAYVETAVSNLVDSAPGALNTLNELAAALGDDANFSTTVTNSIATKLPLAGGTLTGNVIYNDDVKALFGTGSDLHIYHDGTDSKIVTSTGDLWVQTTADDLVFKAADDINFHPGTTENGLLIKHDAGVELYYDNSKKAETYSNGFKINGQLQCEGDVKFDNPDNAGRDVRWDSSDDTLEFSDNTKAGFGNGTDLQIWHDGTNSYIDNDTGGVRLNTASGDIQINKGTSEYMGRFITDGAVELFYDNAKKFETTSNGATLSGHLRLDLGSGNDAYIYNSSAGGLIFQADENGHVFQTWSSSWQTRLTITDGGNVRVPDNGKFTAGSSDDLQIYHDGSHSYIANITGNLYITEDSYIELSSANGGEKYATFLKDGGVDLYYDDSKKLETKSYGLSLHGNVLMTNTDNQQLKLGAANDLIIYHDGSNTFFDNLGAGSVVHRIQNGDIHFQYYDGSSAEEMAVLKKNGAVELFYDNAKKFETTSAGCTLTGSLTGTGHVYIPDGGKFVSGASNDLQIFHSGVNSVIDNNTGGLYIRNNVGGDVGGDIFIQAKSGENSAIFTHDGGAALHYDNAVKLETTSAGATVTGTLTATAFSGDGSNITGITSTPGSNQDIDLDDNKKFICGNGDDLQIYHNGTDSYLKNTTNDLYIHNTGDDTYIIATDDIYLKNGDDWAIKCIGDASVELYYNNAKTFTTNTNACTVWGTEGNNATLYFHADDGDDWADYWNITATTAGQLDIQCRNNSGGFQDAITAIRDGAVELYYDGLKKLETTSVGVLLNDDTKVLLGNSADMEIYHNGSDNIIYSNKGDLKIISEDDITAIKISEDGTVDIGHNADNIHLRLGAGSDLKLYHDGSNSYITNATGDILIQSASGHSGKVKLQPKNGENSLTCDPDGAVTIYHDNTKHLQTSSVGVKVYGAEGGDAWLELYADEGDDNADKWGIKSVASDNSLAIQNYASGSWEKNIEANGNGNVELYYDNTLRFQTTSGGVLASGTLESTGLIYSNNNDIKTGGDTGKLMVGASNDLQIYHNGSHNYIDSSNGNVYIRSAGGENMAIFQPDSGVNLYFNNSKKFETTSSGVTVTGYLGVDELGLGDNEKAKFGNGEDLQIWHDGSNSYLWNGTNSLIVRTGGFSINDAANAKNSATFDTDGAVELYHDNFKSFETWSNGIYVYGPEGGGGIIRLYGDEGDDNADKWDLNANTNGTLLVRNYASGSWEYNIIATGNGGVELYYDNSKKLETTSTGIWCSGYLSGEGLDIADNKKLLLGSGDDLEIYHDGNNSFVQDSGTGELKLAGNVVRIVNADNSETQLKASQNGAVELYYDNTKKLETTAHGIKVYGAEGNNGVIQLAADEGDDNADLWRHLATVGSQYFLSNYASGGWEHNIGCTANGSVELYYDNSKKFHTNSGGVEISGHCYFPDNNGSHYGAGEDLRIYHDGSNSYLKAVSGGTGNLYIFADGKTIFLRPKSGEDGVKVIPDGAVELYYDNSKKIETLSGGAQVTGGLTITGQTYLKSELNLTVKGNKYIDTAHLDNALRFRRISDGDTGHSDHCTVSSAGLWSADFNDVSDEKLKENIVAIADGAISKIKQLRPVNFDWKDTDKAKNVSGFIAQELKTVLPNLVYGTEYDPTIIDQSQGIKSTGYSVNTIGIVANLTKALQEAITKIETLETKVAALESA